MRFKMPLLSLFACLLLAGCAQHGEFRPVGPLSSGSYLIVYGTETCPGCQKFKRDLDQRGVRYTFKDINDAGTQAELIPRMEKAGLDTDRYPIPVVDVNGELAVFPSVSDTLERYSPS